MTAFSGIDASLLSLTAEGMDTQAIAEAMGAGWTEAAVWLRLKKLGAHGVVRGVAPAPEPKAPRPTARAKAGGAALKPMVDKERRDPGFSRTRPRRAAERSAAGRSLTSPEPVASAAHGLQGAVRPSDGGVGRDLRTPCQFDEAWPPGGEPVSPVLFGMDLASKPDLTGLHRVRASGITGYVWPHERVSRHRPAPSPYDIAHPKAAPAPEPRRGRRGIVWDVGAAARRVERLRPLTAGRLRYCRWFLAAGWELSEVADLFDVSAEALERAQAVAS